MNESASWQIDDDSLLKYLEDITKILAKYSWIYNVRNTHILVENVLEKIPAEWNEVLSALPWEELKELPFGFIKDDWPESLKTFITECYRLAAIRFPEINVSSFIKEDHEVNWHSPKQTPLKKQVEIKIMSFFINQICDKTNCNMVLDIGSGLGYLDEMLHYNYGLQCVGLDSSPAHTKAAEARRENELCIPSLHYETITVENTNDCIEKIRDTLNEVGSKQCKCNGEKLNLDRGAGHDKSNHIALIGLHCCGSLAQDMMKLFCHMSELKAFVCVGCCFHKMDLNEFPMSQATRNAISDVKEVYPNWSPCTSGRRLGSHRTRSELPRLTPKNWSLQIKYLMYRAVLECCLQGKNIKWHRKLRKIKLKDNVEADFCHYCRIAYKYWIEASEGELQLKKANEMYLEKECFYPQLRILTILQLMLQPLWEIFVTIDRLLFFKENNIRAEVFTLWNDSDSPRNIAICGFRT